MSPSAIRLWFCVAVAVIAAAIADPLLESASNIGVFGPGNFTDHSTLDVAPALLVGGLLLALHLAARVHRLLRGVRHVLDARLIYVLPMAFVFQLAALYCMETAEQLIVWHHRLGGTLWLGAPLAIALAGHALACLVVTAVAVRGLRALAVTTVSVVRFVRALCRMRPPAAGPTLARRPRSAVFAFCQATLGPAGQRAPPLIHFAR